MRSYRMRVDAIIPATLSDPEKAKLACGHTRYTSEWPADNPVSVGMFGRCRLCAAKGQRAQRYDNYMSEADEQTWGRL